MEKWDLLVTVIHRRIKSSHLDCLYDDAVRRSFSSSRYSSFSLIIVDYSSIRTLLPRNFILSHIPTFVCINSTIDARTIAFH